MPVVVPAPYVAPPLRTGREVFIVGAGFSKAICPDLMPTLDELGHRVAEPFRETPSFRWIPRAAQDALLSGRLPGGSLEAWLSHLATPAPFLTEAERLHDQAIALELTQLLVNEIERSQMGALAGPMPRWLTRLVALWDRLAATVITFNYDTLIEHAVRASRMPWTTGYPSELTTAMLLKMHGSIHWWWIPTDRVGNTITRQTLSGSWGDPVQAPPVAGMVRLVVPPLAAKSDYYDLSVVRELWQSAREALMSASRIVFLGYSAPMTDLAIVGLLGNYVLPTVPVIVVDMAPEPVIKRLQDMGLTSARSAPGVRSIPEFAHAYEQEVSHTVAPDLVTRFSQPWLELHSPGIARICGDGPAPQRSVTEINSLGDLTTIIAREWQPGESIVADSIKGGSLKEAIEDAAKTRRRLVLRMAGEPDRAILNVEPYSYSGQWLAVEA